MDSYSQEMVGQVDEASEESSINIKQIRFIRHIGRLDIYDNSREYEIEDDCYVYEVILENNLTHYVSFGQINDIIGDKEWLQGESNCLCNIASS